MQDTNSDKYQNNKIFKKYNELNILDEETTDSIMRLKDRIKTSNLITVKSAKLTISMFIKSLEDDGKELFTEEEAKLEKFEALIRDYPNSANLNKAQLSAYENFKDVINGYIDKE